MLGYDLSGGIMDRVRLHDLRNGSYRDSMIRNWPLMQQLKSGKECARCPSMQIRCSIVWIIVALVKWSFLGTSAGLAVSYWTLPKNSRTEEWVTTTLYGL